MPWVSTRPLTIDDQVLLLWRKHASSLPRFLFRHDQLVIEVIHDTEGYATDTISVQYRAPVRQVLATLDEAGLGWDATVAAYGETRIDNGYSVAALMTTTASAEEAAKRIRDFRALAPRCPFTGPVELGRCAGFDLGGPCRRVGLILGL